MVGTSGTWSMRPLSHQPSDPAFILKILNGKYFSHLQMDISCHFKVFRNRWNYFWTNCTDPQGSYFFFVVNNLLLIDLDDPRDATNGFQLLTKVYNINRLFVCNRGNTYCSISAGSSISGSLGKPLSLLFLTPRPVLLSHQHIFGLTILTWKPTPQ